MLRVAILVGVFSLVIYLLFYAVDFLDLLKHYNKHHPGKCRKLNPEGVYGSEDFRVTSDGLAFITSGLLYGPVGGPIHKFLIKKGIKGKILTYNFQKPDDPVVDLKMKSTKTFDVSEFLPIGITVLEDKKKGEHLVYVVNHPIGQTDRVEKLRYLPNSKELRHEKSFQSEHFFKLNNLDVVREDVFYVSNLLYFDREPFHTLEQFVPLFLNDIVYVDGSNAAPVVTGLNGPNGVVLSPDKKYLYVNFPAQKRTCVYSRDEKDGSLTLIQTVDLRTVPDNLHLSQSGDALYAGCHPLVHKGLAHLGDPEQISPSQVLRLPLKNGKIQEEGITELFYDHGDLISGSTIATVHNDLLLIGSVINNLVVCDTKGPLTAL